MAVATDIRVTANKKSFYNRIVKLKRLLSLPGDDPDYIIYPFDTGAFTPASSNTDDINDELFVFQFPEGAKLMDFQIVSTAEVDTGGAALQYNVIAETTGGTETILITGCTVGRGAAPERDEMDRNVGNMLLDVGGMYLGMKITAAATANAGTGSLRIKGYFFQGAVPVAS